MDDPADDVQQSMSGASARRTGACATISARLVAVAAALAAIVAVQLARAQDRPDLADALRSRLEALGTSPATRISGERIYAAELILRFYAARDFRPVWVSDAGPTARLESLVGVIVRSADHGLRPADYHLAPLERGRGRLGEGLRHLAEIELIATDAFLLFAAHLLAGRVDPETAAVSWHFDRRENDLLPVLERAIAIGDVAGTLDDLSPAAPAYRRLREALAEHRSVASRGGWPVVPPGPTLRLGDRDRRVPLLRKRLAATADRVRDLDSPEFDKPLADAVMSFQLVHGLDVDGLVGSDTTRALNVPVDERIAQITANLERWRWLPLQLASRYILVNIAGFRLEVVDDDRTVMTMRAVVGRPYRRTPVFAASMTYLVFSPYWNVPRSIATRDILPKVRRDPRYLEKQRIRVFRGWADDTPIDPATIDWEGISRPSFPYRLRQDPGPWNALGGVKFMFPNRFNVYLHDTPDRELFEESSRTFSSGCVRIERPADLAEYLLEDPEVWDHEAIRGAMDRRRELTVRVPRPIPVYLLYWTAFIDEAGAVHFRDDVYGQDRRLLVALGQPLPR